MPTFGRACLTLLSLVMVLVAAGYFLHFYRCTDTGFNPDVPMRKWSPPSRSATPPAPCECPAKSYVLEDTVPAAQRADVQKRRVEEYQKHLARMSSSLDTLRFAPSNSPLQYPIQGWSVRPLVPTLIPGLALHSDPRSRYKVSLNVSRGVLSLGTEGDRKSFLILETESLEELNKRLKMVTYTSTVYHIHTRDLVYLKFEHHEAVFTVVIRQPLLPVLYDMGTDLSHHVTVVTKTFMRYKELRVLISSLRLFYKDVLLIVADDSFTTQNVSGDHILHYIMPGGQGWFAGRTLAISQVTTKYFLWVDDDFLFTDKTKIEDLVEVMEATPELDVVGGSVAGNQFYFSLDYEEGDGVTGGCLDRASNKKFQALPNYPQCSIVSGVVNFFLARTDAANRVRFDPKLKRVAHSEFFMDGLGQLMVASCGHVSINHQKRAANAKYNQFRHPGRSDEEYKKQLHYFKNHLKCIRYG